MFTQRKVYGQSKVSECPFCGSQAFSQNSQNIPVCKAHVNETLPDMKCVCGEWLDLKFGKWGPFFTCFNCGIVNLKKAMEMASMQKTKSKTQGVKNKEPVPDTEEKRLAQKFEQLAEKVKSVEDIPTLDELSKNW